MIEPYQTGAGRPKPRANTYYGTVFEMEDLFGDLMTILSICCIHIKELTNFFLSFFLT